MIEDLKILANRRDVPYQSLLKMFLAERLAQERRTTSASAPALTRGPRAREVGWTKEGALWFQTLLSG
jgi:hypothetical protein